MNPAVATLAAALAISLAGCTSFSDSSTSIGRSSNAFSDSVAHSSESSTRSSGERQAAFLRDVRAVAARFASDGGDDVASLERSLGELARGHGILDWAGDDGTWRELGGGFAEAGVGAERFAVLADRLAAPDGRERSLLDDGYAGQRAQ